MGQRNTWVLGSKITGFQASTTSVQDTTGVINLNDSVVYSDKSYTAYYESYGTNALSQNLSQLPKMSYPVFKPLTYAYNNISTGDVYTLSNQIARAGNFYGLNSSMTDSHMRKNSEWGAVVYLIQSKYGRNGEEVTINSKNLNNLNSKNIYSVTGYENDIANGMNAGSTGNKSGVFDLSGCVWEMISGYISNGNINLTRHGASYANGAVNENGYQTLSTKYATVYPYDSTNDSRALNWLKYNSLKSATYGYGDAILEISTAGEGTTSWNVDRSGFPYAAISFISRGGNNKDSYDIGIFAFSHGNGTASYNNGFRAVLVCE